MVVGANACILGNIVIGDGARIGSGSVVVKAVPPSIREAALGIGASKIQTVAHHVLPLAMPGMLTGAIIGMASLRDTFAQGTLLLLALCAALATAPVPAAEAQAMRYIYNSPESDSDIR